MLDRFEIKSRVELIRNMKKRVIIGYLKQKTYIMKAFNLIVSHLALVLISSCSPMMRTMMKNKMFKHYQSKYEFTKTVNTLQQAFEASAIWTVVFSIIGYQLGDVFSRSIEHFEYIGLYLIVGCNARKILQT